MHYLDWKDKYKPIYNEGVLLTDVKPTVDKNKIWYCYVKDKQGEVTIFFESIEKVRCSRTQFVIYKRAGYCTTEIGHNFEIIKVEFN